MEIKERWREHPLYREGKIELVPTEWVWKYWGRDVSPTADLMDGRQVSLDELWENISTEGMYNPLIMRVGLKNKKFRLESGNHRLQLFHKHGITEVPLTVQVREECGPHVSDVMTDASHNFDADGEVRIADRAEDYMKPSEVFTRLGKN